MTTLFEDMMQGLKEVEGFLAGKTAGYRVHVPEQVDVKSIRKQLHMTQAGFSAAFGFSLDAVKHWEGGRRTPEASARAFLTVISKNPGAVLGALHPKERPAGRKVASRAQRRKIRVSGGARVVAKTTVGQEA
jgi:putative transcriptional regulator